MNKHDALAQLRDCFTRVQAARETVQVALRELDDLLLRMLEERASGSKADVNGNV